jgi:CheY-like chemotaxis protein
VQDIDALLRLHDEHWDVVISDTSMPGFSGIDALNACTTARHPVHLRSGTIGEQTAVRGEPAPATT